MIQTIFYSLEPAELATLKHPRLAGNKRQSSSRFLGGWEQNTKTAGVNLQFIFKFAKKDAV